MTNETIYVRQPYRVYAVVAFSLDFATVHNSLVGR